MLNSSPFERRQYSPDMTEAERLTAILNEPRLPAAMRELSQNLLALHQSWMRAQPADLSAVPQICRGIGQSHTRRRVCAD